MTSREIQRERSRRSVLKTGLGVAVGSITLPLVSRRAAAHFPDELAIDIKPGSDRNPIARNCRGVVPVAVCYTTFESEGETTVFDPTDRAVRYRFGAPETVENGGGARPVHDGHTEDSEEQRSSGSRAERDDVPLAAGRSPATQPDDNRAQSGDSDGHDDLVLHFPVEGTGFDDDSSIGKLLWERDESGEHGYAGTDQVTIIG